jgi:hypothetical protein
MAGTKDTSKTGKRERQNKMGWISATDELNDNEYQMYHGSYAGGGLPESPFKAYVPKQVNVTLSIGGCVFEREISEKNIVRQKDQGKWIEVVMLNITPEQVPDYLLQCLPRDAFVAKFRARLGKEWGCTFLPLPDGSYTADQIFLNVVSDVVSRVKREEAAKSR